MKKAAKFLSILISLAVLFSLAGAHAEDHAHQENQTSQTEPAKDASSSLISGYPSSSTALAIIEIVVGLSLMAVAVLHYRRRNWVN